MHMPSDNNRTKSDDISDCVQSTTCLSIDHHFVGATRRFFHNNYKNGIGNQTCLKIKGIVS